MSLLMRYLSALFKIYWYLLLLSLLYTVYGQVQDSTDIDSSMASPDTVLLSQKSDSSLADTLGDAESVQVTRDTVDYEADIIEYDIKKKLILMHGNGIVRYKEMTLYADTIHFLFSEDILIATGYPQLIEGNDTVVGDHMVYNLKNGRGRVRYGTAHSEDSRYDGFNIARSDDKSFYITDGSYTSCALEDSSHYFFYGRQIKVTPGDKAISKPVVLNIAHAPVIALPYYIQPLEKGRKSGWLNPSWGGHVTHGGHLENVGYYWAPNDYTDFKLASKITEFTSYVLTAQARYALRYWLSGGITARYSTSASYDTLNNLWAIDYTHNQNILPDESMKLTGSGHVVSGKSFYKATSEDTSELVDQQINANMSLSKNFRDINAYSNLTWRRDHNFKTNTVTQDLPSFSFTLNSRPLIPYKNENTVSSASEEDKEKWYNKISYSYSFKERQVFTQTAHGEPDETTRHHAGITHGIPINAPQKLFKWFHITPFFNINQSVFDAYIDTAKILDTTYVPVDTIVPLQSVIDPSIPADLIDTVLIDDTLKLRYQSRIDTTVNEIRDTTYWWQDDFSLRKAHSYWWNTGVSLSTKLYGIFPVKVFNFTGMRHTLSPQITYQFTPKKDNDVDYPGIGIGYAARTPHRSQKISFSVNNLFEGRILTGTRDSSKQDEEKTFTMLSGGISASYDFEAEIRKWSNIGLSASIPNKLVDFSYNASFTPYNDADKMIIPKLMNYTIRLSPKLKGASGSLWGGDFLILEGIQPKDYMKGYQNLTTPGWNINFNPSYSFTRSRTSPSERFTTTKQYQLSTNARIKFTNIWSAAWSSAYDFNKNQFMNHSLNFTCDLECWDLKFDWYPSGFNQGYYYFVIRIKKHPDIKWVERS